MTHVLQTPRTTQTQTRQMRLHGQPTEVRATPTPGASGVKPAGLKVTRMGTRRAEMTPVGRKICKSKEPTMPITGDKAEIGLQSFGKHRTKLLKKDSAHDVT